MQCVIASSPHKLWLWPEDVSARFRNGVGGSSSGSSGRYVLRRLNESSSCLGFSNSGVLGVFAEIRELKKKWARQQTALVAPAPLTAAAQASLLMDPAASIVRVLVFYVLLQTGIAGPGVQARHQASSDGTDQRTADGKGPFDWLRKILLNDTEENRAKQLAKVRAKWHASTKGTLVRRYRVPSKAQGKKLLGAIMQLLSDDDTFRDVATHKGCQIRRENAHAESVCCHNVRALFDELPTPHLVVEITVFPAGPITEDHYEKADKIEKVLKTGQSI